MKIALISNYMNHHLAFLSEELSNNSSDYVFIATDSKYVQGFQSRIDNTDIIQYDRLKEEKENVNRILMEYDVVIFGSCPNELIQLRLSYGKLSFLYSERFLKKGIWRRLIPTTYKQIFERILKYKNDNMYVLSASAFLANELALMKYPKEKVIKWGYFPERIEYKIDDLLSKKNKNTILWVGRFLDWKHPDDILLVAKRLKDDGYNFTIKIAGSGEMEQKLSGIVCEMKLCNEVDFLGAMSPDLVRTQMEHAGIYLFTSDFREGWGAVLNESMNSACAVIASHAIGAVPYLMKHNENGLIYHSGSVDGLYEKVKYLLDNPTEQERLGRAAYETIAVEWNAEVAAERFVKLSEQLLAGENSLDLYSTGPCSKAEIIKHNWFME